MIRPHPEADGMTTAEIRAAIAEAEDKLKLAREIPDEEAIAWYEVELQLLEAALARRNGESGGKNEDPPVIVKILAHLGLPTRAPPRSPAQRFDLFQTI
jgi:hypothetical protein